MTKYIVSSKGREHGPYSAKQIRQLAQVGRLSTNDLVWKEGSKRKVKAGRIKGLTFPNGSDQKQPPNAENVGSKATDPSGADSNEVVPVTDSRHQVFFYTSNGRSFGPLSFEELDEATANGRLEVGDTVWSSNGLEETEFYGDLLFQIRDIGLKGVADPTNVSRQLDIDANRRVEDEDDGRRSQTIGAEEGDSIPSNRERSDGSINQIPIVREAKPGLFSRSIVACFNDRVLLLRKSALFSKQVELDGGSLNGDLKELSKNFSAVKEIPKAEISRIVASKIPAWMAGKRSSVIVESTSGRNIKFQCWTDQLPSIVEWLPKRFFLRKAGVFTFIDILVAILMFLVCVVSVPLTISIMAQLRFETLDTIPGPVIEMPSPTATLSHGSTPPAVSLPIGLGFPELLLIMLLAAGIPCVLWVVVRVVRRPCWSRTDLLLSTPIALWGLTPILAAIYNSVASRQSGGEFNSDLWSSPAILFGIVYLSICMYFPFRILIGDRLPQATLEDFALKPKRNWFRFVKPYQNNVVSWVLKIIGLGGMIAFWSPLTQPIFAAVENTTSNWGTAFYAGGLLRIVLTAPPAILLYLGYRLGQKAPFVSANDSRRPILFLRPFNDDQSASIQLCGFLPSICGIDKSVGSYGGQVSERGKTKLLYLWTAVHPVRVFRLFLGRCVDTAEESVVRYFSQFAPVYAIGKPGEVLPTPGANRLYPEKDWRSVILEHLDKSQAVIVQPGVSEGVVWELNRIRERVPYHRVLLNLVSFQRNPEAYERLRRIIFDSWGTHLPREIPFQHGSHFIWLNEDWQPIVQKTSCTCPLTWPFTGNTINLSHTLQPFIQGMHGGDREPPRKPNWHSGLPKLLVVLPTVLLALLVMFLPMLTLDWLTRTNQSNEHVTQLPDSIDTRQDKNTGLIEQKYPLLEKWETPTIPRTYSGKSIDFEFKLDPKWKAASDLGANVEFLFRREGVGAIEISSFDPTRSDDLYDPRFGEGVRRSIEQLVRQSYPLGTVKLRDDKWILINGVRWRAFSMLQKYSILLDEVRYSFYTSGPEGAIGVHLILKNDSHAPRLRDDFFASFNAPKSDLDLLISKSEQRKTSEHLGAKSKLRATLNAIWTRTDLNDMLSDAKDDEVDSLREIASNSDMILRLGNEQGYATLEIDVLELGAEEFDVDSFNEEECRAILAERKQTFATMFGGDLEFDIELVKFEVVSSANTNWLQIRAKQTFSKDQFSRTSFLITRLMKRDGKLISLAASVDKPHPDIEQLVLVALNAFNFGDERQ